MLYQRGARLEIDHILYGVRDLEAGVKNVASLFGVSPEYGGVHGAFGTANYLVSLGARKYLEIIGPIPGETPFAMGRTLRDMAQDHAMWFAAATAEAKGLVRQLSANGFSITGPSAGGREKADGQKLSWEVFEITHHRYGACVPFFIDWHDTPHPSLSIRPKVALSSFSISHLQPDELAEVYSCIGLDIDIRNGGPAISCVLETPNGVVELAGPAGKAWTQPEKHFAFAG